MNRKMFLALLLSAAVAVTGAFAEGQREGQAQPQGPGFYGPGPYAMGPYAMGPYAMGPYAMGHCAQGFYGAGPRWQGPKGPGFSRPVPPRTEQGQAPVFSEEKVAVTGELYFQNRMHPELKSEGKEYELLVPHYYLFNLDLKEGQTVTVEGYPVTGLPFEQEDKDEVHLWLTKAVIDGKEYDVERYGRGGMMGFGGGPMHGRRW